ncbi:MAG: formylglycine-generating enzyme family protein [Proteobacteria bacterium]|nr:formylglycine-generating enzyme family protein [Pseudomonadota bacterium]
MGSPITGANDDDERPQHEVTINYGFEIGKYEVTFDEYDVFASATKRKLPSDKGWGRGKRPVIDVSFDDAQAYVQWLSKQTGRKYRLPTEAEWEYAARAFTQIRYYWGGNIGKNNANCQNCGSQWDYRQTAPVGSFKPNAFGLHDTAGNVREWVQDCWHQSYHSAPNDGSAWLDRNNGDCRYRVVRGGSWIDGPLNLRPAFRTRINIDATYDILGFRIARDF